MQITGIKSREEALAYLPYLDIFVIPSLHDGCPNAMLEAMQAGCAIVGSNVDAIGEILAEGNAGLLVEPGDTDSLATALKQLALNPQLRQTLGMKAKQMVLENLAPSIENQNWRFVYQQGLKTESTLLAMSR